MSAINIYTYKRVVCVCLLVCWSAFYRPHNICPLCGAASEWPREQPSRRRRRPRALARARAHAVQLLNDKIAALAPCRPDAFQKQNRTRACCRIRNCRDFQKKGKRKPTCHFPSSVYSLPSLGVFTSRIVLNRILHKSSLLAPVESRRTRRPTITAEERLGRDRRRHAERRARERREQTQARRMWIACGLPKPVPRRRWKRRRPGGMWIACSLPKPVPRRRWKRRRQGGMWSACGSSQARAAETVEETAARTEVQRLRSSQARNRRRIAVTRAGETIIGDFSQNCADIHHRTWLRLGFLL